MFKKLYLVAAIIAAVFIAQNNIQADMACDDYKFNFNYSVVDDPPAASSYLSNKKKPMRYSPQMAFDGKLSTSWVEGAKGDGIGEKIAFRVDSIKQIIIFPGYGEKKYFKKNNRIKKIMIKVFPIISGGAHQCAVSYGLGKLAYERVLTFKDKMSFQSFNINPGTNEKGFIIFLEIVEVYRGTKWRDTCIAEIKIK